MISQDLKQKLILYENIYFPLDEPVPFKKNLFIYPILVKDQIKFQSMLQCLLLNKNTKIIKVKNEFGVEEDKEVSDPKGISMSYMTYLISKMQDKEEGQKITSQILGLFELCFHIQNGLYCPNCKKNQTLKEIFELHYNLKEDTPENRLKLVNNFFNCPTCGTKRREYISIKNSGNLAKFCIGDEEFTSKDFDEFKAIVTHYNILGYDGDEYIDPDLKADLELKKKLENKDYTSPSLEKQIICVSISTSYKIEEIKNLTMRKLSYMLKIIDRKEHYFSQMQGLYSGMVKFKEDPKHWIFGDNEQDLSKEIMTVKQLKDKFKDVT